MKRILFICHGNICRSPMAEMVLRKLAKDAGKANDYIIASAATSREEIGHDVYPPARECLEKHGVPCLHRGAREMTRADYMQYDLIIGMDEENRRYLNRITNNDPIGRVRLLMDFTDRPGSVADPWYTGDFEATWRDVEEGCRGLFAYLEGK